MKRPAGGSTLKQYAYATRRLSGDGKSRKEAALLSGFSRSVANNVGTKVENTEGYKNAVIQLAVKSNNLLLAAMTEFELRGFTDFSNADLVKALNAIGGAWKHIEDKRAPNQLKTPEGNPLLGVFQRRVETQTAYLQSSSPSSQAATPAESIDLDF